MHSAFLALGSNISPEKNLYSAWVALGQSLEIVKSSSIWESPPYGAGGPNFLNAIILVKTALVFDDLKWNVLRELETRLGRVRTEDKYAPRPIDLDVIIFDDSVLEGNLWRLAYLAAPCAEILPNLLVPESRLPLLQIARKLALEQNTNLRFCTFPELVGTNAE
ncbi:MAG: 2-amino-4-hydroxy-6-hydroxymethyldihydropteridine diphosphokinase [Anaerolineaceae bacterium]